MRPPPPLETLGRSSREPVLETLDVAFENETLEQARCIGQLRRGRHVRPCRVQGGRAPRALAAPSATRLLHEPEASELAQVIRGAPRAFADPAACFRRTQRPVATQQAEEPNPHGVGERTQGAGIGELRRSLHEKRSLQRFLCTAGQPLAKLPADYFRGT